MTPVRRSLADADGPHVFVDDVDRPELTSDDRHHLSKVLRLRPGTPCTVGDGLGRWRSCRFGDELAVDDEVVVDEPPAPVLTIAFALVKGGRPELVVQKLTELGVDVIIPFAAERSVVRWDEAKAAQQLVRLRRVGREAAMQCHRSWLPEIRPLATFAAVAALPGAALAQRGGGPVGLGHPVVCIGPEGGWSREELSSGRPMVSLGEPVLRAETAAIAAAALLTALRTGLVGPVAPG